MACFSPLWPSSVWNHTNVESLSKAAAWSKVSVDVGLPDRRILILEFSLKPTASIASVATGNGLPVQKSVSFRKIASEGYTI
ncbi:MAG: hypothetical protein ACLS4A_12845 [Oscillospiraceae bacterium]